MSSVNVSEVVAKLLDRRTVEQEIRSIFQHLPIAIRDFDREQAMASGLLRPLTRSVGLSLGDRACLNLAVVLGTPVLTTDRAWQQLSLPIEVIVVR